MGLTAEIIQNRTIPSVFLGNFGNVSMNKTFKMMISSYSLAVGKIGEPTGRPPLVVEFDKSENAMRELYRAIERQEGSVPGEGTKMLIEMPDGRELALNTVYREVFGADPVRRDNSYDLYPMLFPKGQKKIKVVKQKIVSVF